jgi:hypothetical protein
LAADFMNQPPVFPTVSTSTPVPFPLALAPIVAFFDTDTYTGSAPISRTETNIGLAEYTNANYFSDDTINSSDSWHTFPFPLKNPAAYTACIGPPPNNVIAGPLRRYMSRVPCNADGTPADHFIADSLLNYQNTQPDLANFVLDDHVYADYAKELFPRAVGYSAGLIDYFFRGKLAIVLAGLNGVKVRNNSSEPLSDGTLSIWYDNGAYNRIWLGEITLLNPISPGQMSELIPVSPPSDNTIPGRYWVVFQGTLGSEANAVIGSFTDLEWVEEWDQGFTGRHPWWVRANDPYYNTPPNPGGSFQPTTVQNGIFTMTNFRPAGTQSLAPNYGMQTNLIDIGLFNSDPYFASNKEVFPKTIGPNAFVRIKVDVMSSIVEHATVFCGSGQPFLGPGAYQHVALDFINSGGTVNTIYFTVPGQDMGPYSYPPPSPYVYMTLGTELRMNVYQIFQNLGIPMVAPIQLNAIRIEQHLWALCTYYPPTSMDEQQTLQMDYIRLTEEPLP